MPTLRKKKPKTEFGDFQTPSVLAGLICRLVRQRGFIPASIVEPTCGLGSFVLAALDVFPESQRVFGVEINPAYVDRLRATLEGRGSPETVSIACQSFFDVDWSDVLDRLPEPILVVGNPPWVTNTTLGKLGSDNLPVKSNFQKRKGMDAITGKSNFDVSEWMLIRLFELLNGRAAAIAILCKSAVARKVLHHAWRKAMHLAEAAVHGVDAAMHFDAAVEACLLFVRFAPGQSCREAAVFRHLGYTRPDTVFGCRDGLLVSDMEAFARRKELLTDCGPHWRSGIKHDCSSVMELRRDGSAYRNGSGERVLVEDTYLFPMMKSSEIADSRCTQPRRWMVVPQRSVGADTTNIHRNAPQTWKYLQRYAEQLARRASSIYRNRPAFSIFGVGEYSFTPWKVAISGLYKKLTFSVVGPYEGKPVVFDDTCYFLPCSSESEAMSLHAVLQSEPAQEFLNSLIFWDAKRPITVEVLRRLDVASLATRLGYPLPSLGHGFTRVASAGTSHTSVLPGLFG